MAANISGLHQFADDVGPLPLKLLDDSYSTLSIALNTLSTFSNFYQDQGTTNAYTIQTTQYQFVAYSDGLQVTVRIANTNTGASTLNVNGLGAMPILTSIGTELQPNALVAGSIVTFVYNAQRSAWQIASGGAAGGQITAPLHVTNPTGQQALSINVDGSGYLGDFNGNGFSWDASGNLTLGGNSVVAHAPFQVVNDAGQVALEINPDGNGYIGPFTSDVNSNGLRWTADGTTYYFQDGALLNGIIPPFSIGNVFALNADCSGAIGCAPNQLVWDAQGHFTLTGTATLPMPPLIDLPGINITNPQNGEALVYDAANNQWVNGAPVNALATLNDVALSNPLTGQTLTYNAVTQRWVNSPPVLTLEQLQNTHVSGPAPGQVLTYSLNPQPGWVNATIPGYTFLTNLGVGPNPAPGWVLTWDGQAWVGAAPGEVSTFPLSSLTDVGITTPLNRQVLTYDAPSGKWINAPAASPSLATLPDVHLTSQSQGQVLAWDATLNRWVNSALPGGSVIALDTLMDTNISDAQDNQVLTWDYASARWVNRALPPTFTPVFTNPSAGQILSYNGTNWINSAAPVSTLAGLSDVALAAPVDGQVLGYNGTTARWANHNWVGLSSTSNLSWNQTYGFILDTTPAASQFGLVVRGGTFSTLTVEGQSHSGTNVFSVSGGSTAADTVMVATDATGSNVYFRIFGDGHGYVGANSTNNLSWTSGGNIVIKTPAGGYALTVDGSGLFQGPQGWPLDIQNSTAPAVGNIAALRMGVVNAFSGFEYCSVQAICENAGNATVGLGLFTNPATPGAAAERVRISGFGNVTIQSPDSGTALRVNGALTAASNGVDIAAGTGNSAEFSLRIQNRATNTPYFTVDGRGWIYMFQLPTTVTQPNVTLAGPGNRALYEFTSSRRYKTNIKNVARARARAIVSQLRSVTFTSLCEVDDPKQECFGMIAEEVAAIDPALATVDKDGNPRAVAYDRVLAILLPLMQEMLGMDEPEGEVYG